MKVWKQEEWTNSSVMAENGRTERNVGKPLKDLAQVKNEEAGDNNDPDEAKEAREKAVYYLQFSGKTENELRKKLAEKEFSPASVDSAIEFVKKYRYLDDEDYARRFVEKNGNKKSRKQMIYELSQKGVSREILDLVFEDMDVDEATQILAILEKRKYPREGASREEKQKISAYLARKGFSYDAISSALIQFARKSLD
ncbi:MAG: regulatory protein RecX [Lachnospiraceae bacterium]|nr:regulatory protein RecX [Lachnospiraceae bacterium]